MAWRIGALVLKGVAVLCVGFAVFTFLTPRGSTSWRAVEAHALSSRFTGVVSPIPPGRGTSSGGSAVFPRYWVEYEYTVGGVSYTGSGAMRHDPRHGAFPVYVDPQDPASSVIEPGVDSVVMIGALAVGGLAYVFARMVSAAGGR